MEDAIKKRLIEKKSLDEIGRELCDNVDDPRGKVIRYIKKMPDHGDPYLIDNADWLHFDVSKINNPQGINRPKNFGQENAPKNIAPLEKITEWNEKLKNAIEILKEIEVELGIYNFNTEEIHSINIQLQQIKGGVNRTVNDYDKWFENASNVIEKPASNGFTVKALKKILKLVSTNGKVKEFILRKDGSVVAVSTDGTMMVSLKYKGIELPEDTGVDDIQKFLGAISRFDNSTEVEVKDNQYIIGTGTVRVAIIPRLSIDAIRKKRPFPEIAYAIAIKDVPLHTLKRAVKNKTKKIEDHYTFAIEEGILKVIVEDDETGTFTENIFKVVTDKTLHSTFQANVPQVVKTLEGNPTISMGDDIPIKLEVTTDKYSVSYLLAPSTGQVFIWDDIPGKDNGKLIEFLKIRFGIDWIENAKIEKIDEGKTIRVYFKNNFLSLTLNEWKNRVNIKIDDGRTDEIVARTVNGKLYIYKEMSFQDMNDYVAVTDGMDK